MSGDEFGSGRVPARAWAEIDLDAIAHNVRQIARLVAPAEVMAVVKADGYGHGAVQVARAALDAGASRLAVATLREATELREAGIDVPVQVLGVVLPGSEDALLRMRGAVATVSSMDEAKRIAAAAAAAGARATVHLKMDSGMHRLGALRAEAEAVARFAASCETLRFEGAMTHLATAGTDAAYADRQLAAFADFTGWMGGQGIRPPVLHAANSAGLALYPQSRHGMVRPGLAIYGIADPPEIGRRLDLRPAMRLCARVVAVKQLSAGEPVGYGCTWRAARESVIATASIGYADGLRTAMSNQAHALLRGERVPVVGRVSMDFTALDVTGMDEVVPGDEAVFVGRQGEEEISAVEAAASMEAIPYELVCGVSFRVWRVAK